MVNFVRTAIPYAELETVFLDAGNTLVSLDFEWVLEVLAGLGVESDLDSIQRAEAAARPAVSMRIARGHSTEGDDPFVFYLGETLRSLLPAASDGHRDSIARSAARTLREPNPGRPLWGRRLSGAPEALALLRGLDLRLIVVSNSDGRVEEQLAHAGLRDPLEFVVDSHRVGIEKPDPAIFRHALERANADAARTLHVGDIYHVDVVGARAAGLHAALLDPYDDWPEADCARFRDVGELATELARARG